jgi:hypothetical protein
MKKILNLTLLFSAISFASNAQAKKAPTFTKAEQQEIQKILGNDFAAVLGNEGQIAGVIPSKVGGIISTKNGGFRGLPSAANATFMAYEKAWIYKQSGKDIQDKLGKERFNQLNSILTKKIK